MAESPKKVGRKGTQATGSAWSKSLKEAASRAARFAQALKRSQDNKQLDDLEKKLVDELKVFEAAAKAGDDDERGAWKQLKKLWSQQRNDLEEARKKKSQGDSGGRLSSWAMQRSKLMPKRSHTQPLQSKDLSPELSASAAEVSALQENVEKFRQKLRTEGLSQQDSETPSGKLLKAGREHLQQQDLDKLLQAVKAGESHLSTLDVDLVAGQNVSSQWQQLRRELEDLEAELALDPTQRPSTSGRLSLGIASRLSPKRATAHSSSKGKPTSESWRLCRRRGPERFFYDKTTYTGVHTCGGPNTVCKDNFIASLRHGLKLSMFVRNPGLQPRSYPFNLPGGNKGPERFFYDRTSYTGVHQCGGPTVIDKENDFHGNFCRSLRPKSSQPHRSRPSDRDLQLHRSRPSDSNVRFLQSKTEDTAESLAHMRLALLNTRLERNRFGDLSETSEILEAARFLRSSDELARLRSQQAEDDGSNPMLTLGQSIHVQQELETIELQVAKALKAATARGDGEVRTLHGWCGSLLQKTRPFGSVPGPFRLSEICAKSPMAKQKGLLLPEAVCQAVSRTDDGEPLPTLLTPSRKRQQELELEREANVKPVEGDRKTKLQERRPKFSSFRTEPLTLQPGLKFYSPPAEDIPDVPDPESRRHRAAKTSKENWPSESASTSTSASPGAQNIEGR
eukprot:symbB.v1.2.023119.t2/scaffold2087.1/size89970/4